jgi:predicted RNase H-like HicB family nuclease
MTRYTVTAEPGSRPGVWVFQCREFPGAISQSRRLADAPMLMREAIAFVAEVEESAVEIDLVPTLPAELEVEVRQAREAVHDLEQRQRAVAELSRRAARDLLNAGLTGADTAVVLGVSPQRVSQLVNS